MHRLHNGLTLVLLPSHVAPVVAIQAWVGVGSADERADQAGLSHVMEHMLFKGTSTRGVGGIARDVESAGGEINAWTSRDNTVFHVVMPSRFADVGIDVLSDALQYATLDPGELDREREVILEEIRQGRDEPLRALVQNMFAGAFERHPYARPVIGSEASVAGFQRKHLAAFRERWYRGGNMALVVAGDFDPAEIRRRVIRSFAGVPEGTLGRRRSRASNVTGPSAQLEIADVRQSQLAIAFRAPEVSSTDFAALDLLSVAFGQGESSTLANELVRERELCKTAYAYVHALKEGSLFILGASAEPAKLQRALPIIGKKLRELIASPIDQALLDKARHIIETDSVYQRETAEGSARSAGSYLSLVGDANFEASYLRGLASLNAEDLQAAAKRYLDPARMHVTALVPGSASLSDKERRARAASRILASLQGAMQGGTKPKASPSKIKNVKAADDIVEHRLKSGMKLIIKRDASVPIVAARAVWSGGQLLETPAKSGITELMASTVTLGCGRRSAEEIIEEVDGKAATLAGFAGRNSFGVRTEWLRADWSQGLDLLTDCLLDPHFDDAEVARSKREQLARIETQKDNPSHQAFRLFRETLFRKHAYRLNAQGTSDSVRSLKSTDLRTFYRKYYRVADMTLAIVGDVDPQQLIARIESRFGGEKALHRPLRKETREEFSGRDENARTIFGYMQREQAHLVLGFPGVTIYDSDRYALEVLTTVLGGQGGRLFVELRDRQSLAYQIGAFSLEGLDPGYVAMYLSCSPDKADEAHKALAKEIDAIVVGGVSDEELVRTKHYLIGTHEISLQRRSSLASAMAFHDAYGLSFNEHTQYAAHVQKVSAADLKRVAQRIFDWDLAVTATVMPPSASPKAGQRMKGVIKKRPKLRREGKKAR